MFVEFYKVNDNARFDFMELCKSSTAKIDNTIEEGEYIMLLNKKIRKCANLGRETSRKNGYVIKHYFNLMFTIKDYTIICIQKSDIKPYLVNDYKKYSYDFLEKRVSKDNREGKPSLSVNSLIREVA